MKRVYLSEKIGSKESIVKEYLTQYSNTWTKENIEGPLTRLTEIAWTRKLGGSGWKELVKKHDIPQTSRVFIGTDIFSRDIYRDILWGGLLETNYFDFPTSRFPVLTLDHQYQSPLLSLSEEERVKYIGLLYRWIGMRKELYYRFLKEGIIGTVSDNGYGDRLEFLPGLKTYGDLKSRFPQLFDICIQSFLKDGVDQVKIITTTEEIKELQLCLN